VCFSFAFYPYLVMMGDVPRRPGSSVTSDAFAITIANRLAPARCVLGSAQQKLLGADAMIWACQQLGSTLAKIHVAALVLISESLPLFPGPVGLMSLTPRWHWRPI
jgi:hypothetical protein